MWPVSLFGVRPLIRHALRRATFPVGEGDLPAGERSSGAGFHFQVSPPHPARATPGPPSPSRRGQEPLIRQGLWPCHLPRRGRRPPGGGAFIGARLSLSGVPSTPGPGYTRSTLSKQERATSRRGKAQRAFSGPCVFWHCMVQCPKIGKRQVERGAFSVQSQDPAGHYGVLCEAPEPMAPG